MQNFADEFVNYIEVNGGQIHYSKQIRSIRIEDGLAEGVETQEGEFISADWVISAIDLRRTCIDLIRQDHLPSTTIEILHKACPSESMFSVFLGLNDSTELKESLKRFHKSHVSFTCADGKCIQLVLLSKDDSSVAPEGKQALFIGMLSPYEDWENTKDNPKAYLVQKNEYINDLLKRGEEFISGLRAHIEVQEAASPLTYERYTSNWQAGSAGWNWNPKMAPKFDFAKDIPIKNFYPVGHYVFNPGGVPTAMITSWYIAKEILKQV
jgi:prolycopene isomerase